MFLLLEKEQKISNIKIVLTKMNNKIEEQASSYGEEELTVSPIILLYYTSELLLNIMQASSMII